LEALILQNSSDVIEITSYGAKTPDIEYDKASLRSWSDIPSFDGGSARFECNIKLICSKVDTRPTLN
jgi:hypothetical protein